MNLKVKKCSQFRNLTRIRYKSFELIYNFVKLCYVYMRIITCKYPSVTCTAVVICCVSYWKCKTQSRVEISFRSFVLRINETFQRLSRLHTELILIVSRRRDAQFGARLVKCFNYICMLRPQCKKKCSFQQNVSEALRINLKINIYISVLTLRNPNNNYNLISRCEIKC